MGNDEVETQHDQAERIGDAAAAEQLTAQEGIDALIAESERVAVATHLVQSTIVRTLQRENKVLKVLLGVAIVLGIVAASTGSLLSWRSIYRTGPAIVRAEQSADNAEEDSNTVRKILTKTIEGKDEQLGDYKVIVDQAVIYITNMAKQIAELGGEPPEVVLNPDAPLPEATP